MRDRVTEETLMRFAEKLGTGARGPGRVYLTGGATAVLMGWRDTTIDLDLKLDPEPAGVFEMIAKLKDELSVNVELAAPDDFVPALPGWEGRSRWIATFGEVDFYHYDFYGQVLSKVERDLEKDRGDVAAMIAAGLVDPKRLLELFEQVESDVLRYPAIDPGLLKARLIKLAGEIEP
jgi:hypothetical protein